MQNIKNIKKKEVYIISKYKDYYDYLKGIYGVDEKLVLDRRDFDIPYVSSHDERILIHVAGKMYEGLKKNDKYYWGEQLAQFHIERKLTAWEKFRGRKENDSYNVPITDEFGKQTMFSFQKDNKKINESKPIFGKKYCVNEELNCPIVMNNMFGKSVWQDSKFCKFPHLAAYNFGGMLTPDEIWIELSNWLSKTKDIPDTMTNKEKIVSAGFDLKTSFRKDKKS